MMVNYSFETIFLSFFLLPYLFLLVEPHLYVLKQTHPACRVRMGACCQHFFMCLMTMIISSKWARKLEQQKRWSTGFSFASSSSCSFFFVSFFPWLDLHSVVFKKHFIYYEDCVWVCHAEIETTEVLNKTTYPNKYNSLKHFVYKKLMLGSQPIEYSQLWEPQTQIDDLFLALRRQSTDQKTPIFCANMLKITPGY